MILCGFETVLLGTRVAKVSHPIIYDGEKRMLVEVMLDALPALDYIRDFTARKREP